MSTPDSQPDSCPVCGCAAVTYWEDRDTWICDDCSYVIDGTGEVPDTESPVETGSDEKQTNESEDRDWKQRISVTDTSEANLVTVLSQVEELADEVSLSDEVMLQAAEIVTTAWEENFMHGRTKEDTVAAAVYAASRDADCAVPPGILATAVGTEKQTVKSTYTQLKTDQEHDLGPPSPCEYVEFLCRTLALPAEVRTESEEVLAEHDACGGNPIGIAAAGVYEVATNHGIDLTLQRTARVSDLTKETVWRHTRNLRSSSQ